MIELLKHEVRMRRGSVLGWTTGLGFFCSMYMGIFTVLPAEVRNLDVMALAFLQSLGMRSFASFEGFILATAFNFLPLLAGVFGVFMGIGALAAEEDDGTLELLAALPVSRTRLILAKALAIFIAAFIVLTGAGVIASVVFKALRIETSVTVWGIFRVVLSHWLMAFVFMTLSLLLGAVLPGRSASLSAGLTLLFVSFFGDNLAGMAPALRPLQPFFPHSYFERIVKMLNGPVAWPDVLALFLMGAGFLALAVIFFRRRDLTVAAWPWQRRKPGVRRLQGLNDGIRHPD
jgi:ABC-2 type transport system permease protein